MYLGSHFTSVEPRPADYLESASLLFHVSGAVEGTVQVSPSDTPATAVLFLDATVLGSRYQAFAETVDGGAVQGFDVSCIGHDLIATDDHGRAIGLVLEGAAAEAFGRIDFAVAQVQWLVDCAIDSAARANDPAFASDEQRALAEAELDALDGAVEQVAQLSESDLPGWRAMVVAGLNPVQAIRALRLAAGQA